MARRRASQGDDPFTSHDRAELRRLLAAIPPDADEDHPDFVAAADAFHKLDIHVRHAYHCYGDSWMANVPEAVKEFEALLRGEGAAAE